MNIAIYHCSLLYNVVLKHACSSAKVASLFAQRIAQAAKETCAHAANEAAGSAGRYLEFKFELKFTKPVCHAMQSYFGNSSKSMFTMIDY